jgi:DNA modification methylase
VAEVIHEGDCREVLRSLPAGSVQTCVTSPPYFGLRDYGSENQIGLEPTPDEFVQALVSVFREVRRVLRDDGTVWLNLGDSYASGGSGGASPASTLTGGGGRYRNGSKAEAQHLNGFIRSTPAGLKPKDLIGIPWMVAFALRADGWYLRLDIIWSKPNPMPESVTDRPTKAHEYVFLLSKGPRYFYDADAIREQGQDWSRGGPGVGIENTAERYGNGNGGNGGLADLAGRYKNGEQVAGRNRRSVWTVATQPYAGAHFATFPPKLIEPCILAGSAPGDVVLDPFAGAGTTGVVASWHGREFIGIELNPEYAAMARERIRIEGKPGGKTHEPLQVHADQLGLL